MSIRLEHRFTVPVPVEEAWDVLLDVERVAPCMPGATLESVDGDAFTGKVRVKVGPITVTYRGEARITEKDPRTRTVRIEASGKEARGSGTASGTVLARLAGPEGSTEVTVETDITVTGRVAQFGRGVMADVSERLVSRFADNLAAELAGSGGSEPEPAAAEPAAPPESGAGGAEEERAAAERTRAAARASREADQEALDLLRTAGVPVLKRVLPLLAGAVVAVLVLRRLRRRCRRRSAPRR
ncbi:SRPBCC family protein [Nocardiopsis composta]|uniref:Carbon monoxide dehydrogenase subunit G n=1 Tax=Nocardiopsis composta TaxID=157465 RepID=A0A7W8QMZ5_9ACTN|nr:SRPBCC family protein [Nocardiopsis composta]MBB5432989.1 carbon monoxide dehydrogenase subunit G [Nocardiopsis composta]